MNDPGRAPDTNLFSKLKSGDVSFWDDLRAATAAATSFSEILALSTQRRRAIHMKLGRPEGDKPRPLKLALLGGYTPYPLSELITHFLMAARVDAELHVGEFDNYAAEIMEPEGELAAFKPDLVVLLPS